jgi:hypothetical protein
MTASQNEKTPPFLAEGGVIADFPTFNVIVLCIWRAMMSVKISGC